jgi:hypothetical protein
MQMNRMLGKPTDLRRAFPVEVDGLLFFSMRISVITWARRSLENSFWYWPDKTQRDVSFFKVCNQVLGVLAK